MSAELTVKAQGTFRVWRPDIGKVQIYRSTAVTSLGSTQGGCRDSSVAVSLCSGANWTLAVIIECTAHVCHYRAHTTGRGRRHLRPIGSSLWAAARNDALRPGVWSEKYDDLPQNTGRNKFTLREAHAALGWLRSQREPGLDAEAQEKRNPISMSACSCRSRTLFWR